MKVLYKANLELGKRNADDKIVIPSLEQIIDVSAKWINSKTRSRVSREELSNNEKYSMKLNLDMDINSFHDEEDNDEYFGFELRHPDSTRPSDKWVMTFATKVSPASAIAQVTLGKEYARAEEERMYQNVARPNLVPMLIDELGAKDDTIRTSSIEAPGSDAENFAIWINSPLRKLPIVYASRTNTAGRLLMDPGVTANQLCGIAHVVVPENLFASREIEKFMNTKDTKCYDGTVRLYWPHFAGQLFNRYFTKDELARLNSSEGMGFPAVALNVISSFLAKGPDTITINDVKQVAVRKEQKRLSDVKDYQALAENIATECTDMKSKVASLENALALKEQESNLSTQEIDRQKEEISTYQRLISDFQKTLSGKEAELKALRTVKPEAARFNTVYDAVVMAQRLYSDRLEFFSRAVGHAKKSKYEDAESVFKGFTTIATTYFDSRHGRAKVTDLKKLFAENADLEYHAGQSEITMTRWYEEYHATLDDGRVITLEEHLRKGSGREERTNLSIGFHYDAKTGKFFVGYIGVHQTNTKS